MKNRSGRRRQRFSFRSQYTRVEAPGQIVRTALRIVLVLRGRRRCEKSMAWKPLLAGNPQWGTFLARTTTPSASSQSPKWLILDHKNWRHKNCHLFGQLTIVRCVVKMKGFA